MSVWTYKYIQKDYYTNYYIYKTQPAAVACVELLKSSDLVCCELFPFLLTQGFFSGVTIMLSITIFATIVGEMLPVSDATPLIG